MEQAERWDDIWNEKRRSTSGRLGLLLARDIIYRTVASILHREIPDPAGKRVLETGSGTGLVTLDLARRGANVAMLDLSPEAIAFSRALYAREGERAEWVRSSILDLPFGDDVFDVIWNGGVVEHFDRAEQVRIVQEMLRVTRSGGRAIVIVPAAEAHTYSRAKRFADRHGLWQPGYEAPMTTLKDIAAEAGGRMIREYRTGRLAELHFLKYFFGRSRALRLGWCGLVEILSLVLSPLNNLPGYLLVSVITPEEDL